MQTIDLHELVYDGLDACNWNVGEYLATCHVYVQILMQIQFTPIKTIKCPVAKVSSILRRLYTTIYPTTSWDGDSRICAVALYSLDFVVHWTNSRRHVNLSNAEVKRLDSLVKSYEKSGQRYPFKVDGVVFSHNEAVELNINERMRRVQQVLEKIL